jgi:hypothetical protein
MTARVVKTVTMMPISPHTTNQGIDVEPRTNEAVQKESHPEMSIAEAGGSLFSRDGQCSIPGALVVLGADVSTVVVGVVGVEVGTGMEGETNRASSSALRTIASM